VKRKTPDPDDNLQQGESSCNNTGEYNSTSIDTNIASVTLLGTAGACARSGACIARLILVSGALKLALDNIVWTLLSAEGAARFRDITRALDVESTAVVLESRKRDARRSK
jgi:hypothetical protein